MEVPKFQPGDVVRLRCGGLPMVVESHETNPLVGVGLRCVWTIQGAVRSQIFQAVTLEKCEPAGDK